MRDHRGEEWLTVAEAAARVLVLPGTIYVWIHRRKVVSHKISGRAHVRLADVARAEAEWRGRAVRSGAVGDPCPDTDHGR